MTGPTLLVQFDADDCLYVIMARSHGRTEPFGPRILRAPPHPNVSAKHETEAGALKDVAKLEAYFAGLKDRKSKQAAFVQHGNGLGGIDDCPLLNRQLPR
jgi:hypothetical protein